MYTCILALYCKMQIDFVLCQSLYRVGGKGFIQQGLLIHFHTRQWKQSLTNSESTSMGDKLFLPLLTGQSFPQFRPASLIVEVNCEPSVAVRVGAYILLFFGHAVNFPYWMVYRLLVLARRWLPLSQCQPNILCYHGCLIWYQWLVITAKLVHTISSLSAVKGFWKNCSLCLPLGLHPFHMSDLSSTSLGTYISIYFIVWVAASASCCNKDAVDAS